MGESKSDRSHKDLTMTTPTMTLHEKMMAKCSELPAVPTNLLFHNSKFVQCVQSAAMTAVIIDDHETLEFILTSIIDCLGNKLDVNFYSNALLIPVARRGCIRCLNMLVKHGIDLHANHDILLKIASKRNDHIFIRRVTELLAKK